MGKLDISQPKDAADYAQALVGEGVKVVGATYSGGKEQVGLFTGGTQAMPGVVDFDDGLILSTGRADAITSPKGGNAGLASTDTKGGIDGDKDFDALSNGAGSFDGAFLEISFVPDGDTVSLDFVFGSEEYKDYVYGGFNDSFAVILNGQNIAVTPEGTPIGIDTINDAATHAPKYGSDAWDPNPGHDPTDGVIQSANPSLYVHNSGATAAHDTEMAGFTRTISVAGKVVPGQVNTLKIGIADSGDAHYDSWVMVRAASFGATLTAEDDKVTLPADGETTFDPLENDASTGGGPLSITRLQGVKVAPGDSVKLSGGQVVTLNKDMTLTVQGNMASPGEDSFTYTVMDAKGNLATGVVTLSTTAPVTCFAAGTRIETPDGPRAVETLRPGDMVLTRDRGAQPVLWAGRWQVTPAALAADPRLRPVRIAPGAFGPGRPARALRLSGQHRVLIEGAEAMRRGLPRAGLAPAQFLTDRPAIRRQGPRAAPDGLVYVHLLMPRHELLRAEGLWVESLFPGPQALAALPPEDRASILRLLPGLAEDLAGGYGPPVRRLLARRDLRAALPA